MYHVNMIDSGYIDFEWDAHKAELNAGKHAVTFEEAAESFNDPYARSSTIPITRTTKSVSSSSA